MKIVLLGYGKMGKIIEGFAVSRGHQITARIDIDNAADFESAQGDVAIEFSHPEAAFENVKKCVNEKTGKSEDLFIESFRIDQVPGTHVVKYESPIDDIEIKHIAHSRQGFAMGAVTVAEWIKDKKGVFSMDDFLKF